MCSSDLIDLIAKGGFTSRANVIVAAAIGLGYGIGADSVALSGMPDFINLVVGGSGIIPCAFLAILLNAVLPKGKEDLEVEERARLADEAASAAAEKELKAKQASVK